MAKLVFGAIALFFIHLGLSKIGSPEAAFWITGALGSFGLISFGLSRA